VMREINFKMIDYFLHFAKLIEKVDELLLLPFIHFINLTSYYFIAKIVIFIKSTCNSGLG